MGRLCSSSPVQVVGDVNVMQGALQKELGQSVRIIVLQLDGLNELRKKSG